MQTLTNGWCSYVRSPWLRESRVRRRLRSSFHLFFSTPSHTNNYTRCRGVRRDLLAVGSESHPVALLSIHEWVDKRKKRWGGEKGRGPKWNAPQCRRGEPSYTAIYLSESPFIPFHQQTASIKSGFGKYTSPSSRSHPIPSHTFRGMFHIMLPASVPTPRRHSFTSCDFSNVKTS